MRLLPVVPLVTFGVPALLARRIGIVVVHVLSSTVGRARQRSRPESNDARECVDGKDHYGDEEDDLPPRHLDHHDPIWTTIPRFPAGSVETCSGKLSRPEPGSAASRWRQRLGRLVMATSGCPGHEHARRPLMSRRPESTARRYGKVFDEIAAEYDRHRPAYPDSLIDRACQVAGIGRGDHVLEVGCGSGQLTRALLARGLRVTAVEPGQNLIAL